MHLNHNLALKLKIKLILVHIEFWGVTFSSISQLCMFFKVIYLKKQIPFPYSAIFQTIRFERNLHTYLRNLKTLFMFGWGKSTDWNWKWTKAPFSSPLPILRSLKTTTHFFRIINCNFYGFTRADMLCGVFLLLLPLSGYAHVASLYQKRTHFQQLMSDIFVINMAFEWFAFILSFVVFHANGTSINRWKHAPFKTGGTVSRISHGLLLL